MAEVHVLSESILLTPPRVHRLQGNLALIISQGERLTINTHTPEICSAPDLAVPASSPVFECSGDAFVGRRFGCVRFGFRSFVPACQLNNLFFYREDYDPMRQFDLILDAAVDIDSSDPFARMSGHGALAGEGVAEAMEILLCLISCGDREASILSARAIKALFRHAGHACYCRAGLDLLSAGEFVRACRCFH